MSFERQRAGRIVERIEEFDRAVLDRRFVRQLGEFWQRYHALDAPRAVGPARGVNRRPADEDARDLGIAVDQFGQARLAEDDDLVEVGQFALRAGGMGIEQRQAANFDSLAIDQLGRADADLEILDSDVATSPARAGESGR